MAILTDSTGVIVVPPFHDLSSERIQLSFAEHDAKLLFFLTYFDRVDVLPFNMPTIGLQTSTELEQTLVAQKLIRPIFPVQIRQPAGWDAPFIASVAETTYEHRNSEESGWAIAGPTETTVLLGSQQANALVMTLARCLPAPHPSTPLGDILAFKAQHKVELDGLRHAINKLALGFRGGVGDAEVRHVVETELLAQVTLVAEAFQKSGVPYFKPDLSISFAVPTVAITALAELIAHALGAPIGTGVAVASAVTFNLGRSPLARADNKHPVDFEYVLGGLREGILTLADGKPFDNDIESRQFKGNAVSLSYPASVTPPRRLLSMPNYAHNFLA